MGYSMGSDEAESVGSSSKSTPAWKRALAAGGRYLNQASGGALDSVRQEAGEAASQMPSYKRGGKVRKTGPALVHRGELVIPKNRVKKVRKAMRKMKGRKSGRG